MVISLPESVQAFLDEQVAKAGNGTASDFILKLLREEQKRQLRAEIDATLIASIESGEPIEITPEYWEQKRRRLLERGAKGPGEES